MVLQSPALAWTFSEKGAVLRYKIAHYVVLLTALLAGYVTEIALLM